MRRILLTSVACALVLGACGGGDGADELAQTVTTTSSSTTTTVDPPAPEPSTTSSTAPPETPRDPQEVLVGLEELPSGWAVSPPDDEEGDTTEEMDCFEDAAGQDFDDNEPDAEVSYQQSEMGPFLGATLYDAGSSDEAASLLDLFAKGLQGCQGFTQTEDDGTETTWSVAPMSFPDLGDATFAARVTTMTFFGPFAIDIVVSRVDELVVFTTHAGIGAPPDAALTEQVQRLQVDRS